MPNHLLHMRNRYTTRSRHKRTKQPSRLPQRPRTMFWTWHPPFRVNLSAH